LVFFGKAVDEGLLLGLGREQVFCVLGGRVEAAGGVCGLLGGLVSVAAAFRFVCESPFVLQSAHLRHACLRSLAAPPLAD